MNEKPAKNDLQQIVEMPFPPEGDTVESLMARFAQPPPTPAGARFRDAQTGEVKEWDGAAWVPVKTRTPQEIRDAQLALTGPPPPVPPGAKAFIPQAPGPVSPSTPEPTLAERLKNISQKLSGAVTTSDYEDYVCLTDFQAAIAELDEIAGEVEKLENYDY